MNRSEAFARDRLKNFLALIALLIVAALAGKSDREQVSLSSNPWPDHVAPDSTYPYDESPLAPKDFRP